MDELDRMREALDTERIAPRAAAREAAIAASLAAYDVQTERRRQGLPLLARLRNATHAVANTLTGERSMHAPSLSMRPSLRHALAGGVSVAVLALAVMTAVNLQTIEGFKWRERNDAAPSATPTAEADAVTQSAGPAANQAATVASNEESEDLADEAMSQPPVVARQALREERRALPPPTAAPLDQSAAASLSAPAEMEAASGMVAPAAPAMMADTLGKVAGAETGMLIEPVPQPGYHDQGRDTFETIETNPLKVTAEEPVSTFSIDVDTSSYAFMRASLNDGVLPQDDAVRVEELINYFPYAYPGPASREEPFAASVTVMPAPWNAGTKLLSIGIKGYDEAAATRPRANLVFLLDTSGSMEEPNKLPLLVNSMKLLVDQLDANDTVAIVTYAGSAGTVLEPTKASDKAKILAALDNLSAGGSTGGAEGIRQAYQLARQNFGGDGVNRVILATDGDFNIGITDLDELQSFVERERESGIFLSVLGFGQGNYNDALMQRLAQNGNGAAAYIDTLSEARKVLVEEATSTLFPIAKDVKIQVEFNPATVQEYRLIGYENRLLNREDFNNDRIDAGEIGSGHTVTAIYEITPKGSGARLVEDLRYSSAAEPAAGGEADEYAFLKIRYKLPDEETSRLIERAVAPADDIGETGGGVVANEARFAAAVAAFGQIVRGGRYTGDFGYDDVIALANASKGEDSFGYRAEFVNLARLAKSATSMERLQRQ